MSIGQVNIFFQMSSGSKVNISMGTETVQDYRIVDNATQRLALADSERKIGLLVYEVESGDYFILSGGITNAHWHISPLMNAKPWVISRTSEPLLLDQHHPDDGLPPVVDSGVSTVNSPADNFTIATTKPLLNITDQWQAVYFKFKNLDENNAAYMGFNFKNFNRDGDDARAFALVVYYDDVDSYHIGFTSIARGLDGANSLSDYVAFNVLDDQLLALAVKQVNGVAHLALFGGKDATASSAPLIELDTGVSFDVLNSAFAYALQGVIVEQYSQPDMLFDGVPVFAGVSEDTTIYPENRAGRTYRVENAASEGSPSVFGRLFNGAHVSFDFNENPVIQPIQLTQADVLPHVPEVDLAALATKEDLTSLATKVELNPLATRAELTPLATKAELNSYATKVALENATDRSAKKVSADYHLVAGDFIRVWIGIGDDVTIYDPASPQIGDRITVFYHYGTGDLPVLGFQLKTGQCATFMYIHNEWQVVSGNILLDLPVGTLSAPPINLEPGERWLDRTDSSIHPILRVKTV